MHTSSGRIHVVIPEMGYFWLRMYVSILVCLVVVCTIQFITMQSFFYALCLEWWPKLILVCVNTSVLNYTGQIFKRALVVFKRAQWF